MMNRLTCFGVVTVSAALSVFLIGCTADSESAALSEEAGNSTHNQLKDQASQPNLSIELAQQIERGRDLSLAESLIGQKAVPVTEELRVKIEEMGFLIEPDRIENTVAWYNPNFVIIAEIDAENRVNRVSAFGVDEFVDGERQF